MKKETDCEFEDLVGSFPLFVTIFLSTPQPVECYVLTFRA